MGSLIDLSECSHRVHYYQRLDESIGSHSHSLKKLLSSFVVFSQDPYTTDEFGVVQYTVRELVPKLVDLVQPVVKQRLLRPLLDCILGDCTGAPWSNTRWDWVQPIVHEFVSAQYGLLLGNVHPDIWAALLSVSGSIHPTQQYMCAELSNIARLILTDCCSTM